MGKKIALALTCTVGLAFTALVALIAAVAWATRDFEEDYDY